MIFVAGFPTTAIDTWNAQDIGNRRPGPGSAGRFGPLRNSSRRSVDSGEYAGDSDRADGAGRARPRALDTHPVIRGAQDGCRAFRSRSCRCRDVPGTLRPGEDDFLHARRRAAPTLRAGSMSTISMWTRPMSRRIPRARASSTRSRDSSNACYANPSVRSYRGTVSAVSRCGTERTSACR